MNYLEDEEVKEVRQLIEECAESLDADARYDYMVNCLVLKSRQNKSIREIFEEELKSKKEFEEIIIKNQ